jgi:hypothetical protein
MPERIYRELRPVVRRQRAMLMLRSMLVGCVVASLIGLYLGVMRLIGRPVSPFVASGLLIGGPVFGLLVGALSGWGWRRAARAVDDHYGLKDRAFSALAFLGRHERHPIQELQLRDAETHLTKVSAKDVVPFSLPRLLPYALILLVAAIALLSWPPLGSNKAQAASAEVLPGVKNIADKEEENLKEIEKFAHEEEDKELEDLAKQLQAEVKEMKQDGVDVKEVLAKLSEMQAAIAKTQQAQYNVGLVNAQLQSLGSAMMAANTTEAAGQALQEGKFDQAAKELEKLEDPPIDKKETKSLEDKLKQLAKAMGDVGLGNMGEATGEMAEGVKTSNKAKFKKATRELAGIAKGHGKRKKIKEILDAEIESLNESKGECNSEFAMRGKKPEKSLSGSTNWGLTTSGNVLGDKTNLQSKRDIKEITGVEGDGSSEMETTHSPEGRQTAARGYRESYQKYKKMSESVLDTEPIPLGHRQAIRKYFELIRPEGSSQSSATKGVETAPLKGESPSNQK